MGSLEALRDTARELAAVPRAIGTVYRRARTLRLPRPSSTLAAAGPVCEAPGCTVPATWPCVCEPVLCTHHGLELLEAQELEA